MNNELSAIRSALSAKLSELAPATLKAVATGRSYQPTGFPFCRFYLVGVQNQLRDNTPSYWRTYQFGIEIIQETTAKDFATAEANFEDAIDAVMDKLNSQWTLSSNVDVSSVESGTISVVENPTGISLAISLLFSAQTLIA